MSVAGGVANAVARARLHGCETLQIFAKNASRWQAPALGDDDARAFRDAVDEAGLQPVFSHASYLINLATESPLLREQSIDALADEFSRAARLGLHGVVLHPGTCTSGTQAEALSRAADAARIALSRDPDNPVHLLFEHTAGQGRTIGSRFEHLAALVERLDGSPRIGVCLDTCHLIASGYDLVSPDGYEDTMARFDTLVGFERLHLIHANDSKKPCGSRVDRHEHIGDGCLGLEPFRRLLHDRRLAGLPMIIETAKSSGAERARAIVLDPLDDRNLQMLRALRGS
jgi:deoxyribonuclease-4